MRCVARCFAFVCFLYIYFTLVKCVLLDIVDRYISVVKRNGLSNHRVTLIEAQNVQIISVYEAIQPF